MCVHDLLAALLSKNAFNGVLYCVCVYIYVSVLVLSNPLQFSLDGLSALTPTEKMCGPPCQPPCTLLLVHLWSSFKVSRYRDSSLKMRFVGGWNVGGKMARARLHCLCVIKLRFCLSGDALTREKLNGKQASMQNRKDVTQDGGLRHTQTKTAGCGGCQLFFCVLFLFF